LKPYFDTVRAAYGDDVDKDWNLDAVTERFWTHLCLQYCLYFWYHLEHALEPIEENPLMNTRQEQLTGRKNYYQAAWNVLLQLAKLDRVLGHLTGPDGYSRLHSFSGLTP
jgi:hypothetical protein